MRFIGYIVIIVLGSIITATILVIGAEVINRLYKKLKTMEFNLPWKSKNVDDVLWNKLALDASDLSHKLKNVSTNKSAASKYSPPGFKYSPEKPSGIQGIINILNEYKCPDFNYCHVYLLEYIIKDMYMDNRDKRLYWLSYALLKNDLSEYNDRFSNLKTTSIFFSKYSKENLSAHSTKSKELDNFNRLQNEVIAISKIMNKDAKSKRHKADSILLKIESVSLKILKYNPNGEINELNSLNNSIHELLELYNNMTDIQRRVFMERIINQLDTIDASIDSIINDLKIEGSDAHFEHYLNISERYLSNFK